MHREVIPFLKSKHGIGPPVITIRVDISVAEREALHKAGLAVPKTEPVITDAMVDTGALRTFISRKDVEQLKLIHRGETPVSQPLSQTTSVMLYDVSIELIVRKPGNAVWRGAGLAPTIQAGLLPDRESGPRRFPMPIVGRDVLSQCVFTYNGPGEQIILEHPKKRRNWFWLR